MADLEMLLKFAGRTGATGLQVKVDQPPRILHDSEWRVINLPPLTAAQVDEMRSQAATRQTFHEVGAVTMSWQDATGFELTFRPAPPPPTTGGGMSATLVKLAIVAALTVAAMWAWQQWT